MKLRATLVLEYDAPDDPAEREATYGTSDPYEMAAVDQESGPTEIVESSLGWFGQDEETIKTWKVEPVEDAK